MSEEREVTPTLQSEKVEVSATEQPHWVANFAKRRRGAPKPPKGTPERAEYDRLANEKSRGRKKAAQAQDAAQINSQVEIDKERAREILVTERNLRHPHVIDVCLELAEVAAQLLKIPKNEHLYRYGVSKTLEALETDQPAAPIDPDLDRWEPGQRIRVHEQFAIFDFSLSWRTQKDGTKIDFDRFQELRRICQTNTYEAGRQVHGKDFAEKPHKQWNDELFVHRNPDLLPENYGHNELSNAMAAQSPIRRRMLLAARNSLKTTFDMYDICGWICTFHDCRFLLCSSTTDLSKSLVKDFRKIFIIRDPLSPTLFQQLWPELCVSDDTSVQNYLCPMRALDFPAPTLQATSAQSGGQAGSRASHIVYEDICEFSNVTTPEQRQKVIEVYSLLNELLDPSGFIMICGTAWAAPTNDGGCGDLYYEILKEEESTAADEKQFKVLIAPCWKVKDGVRKEAYDISLKEDEVELMYPERLTFQWIKSKIGKTLQKIRTFRQQQIVSWVPDEDETLRIQFDPDVLSAAIVNSSTVPLGTTVLSVDIAYSLTSKADRTAIAAVRIHENIDRQKCMTVLDVEADQMRGSELCEKLARMCKQWGPTMVLLEKGPTSDHLRSLISATADKFNIPIPAHFVQTSNVKNIKFQKLKDLELLLAQKRLKFKSGPYLDPLFAELQRIDGTRSSSRKDDRGDAISQVASVFKIYSTESNKKENAEDANEVEKMQRKASLLAETQRYFGGTNKPQPKVEPATPQQPAAPRVFPRGGSYASLPSAFRTTKTR